MNSKPPGLIAWPIISVEMPVKIPLGLGVSGKLRTIIRNNGDQVYTEFLFKSSRSIVGA